MHTQISSIITSTIFISSFIINELTKIKIDKLVEVVRHSK